MYKVLLYTNKLHETDIYARLVQEAQLPIELSVCRSEGDIDANIEDADVIFGVHLPSEVYKKASKLKWIQSMWAGVERLLASPVAADVLITKPWGVFGKYLSHYVFGNLLAQKIKAELARTNQAAKKWTPYTIEILAGQIMGIAGMGDTAQDIALAAKAFGMRVWGLNSDGREHPLADRMFAKSELEEFVSGVDVLVSTLPASPSTYHIFDSSALNKLQSHAILINVGRGTVIHDDSLVRLLKDGSIGGAILDVFHTEPLPAEHPYWTLPNCVVTPHVAGPSLPAEITDCFVQNFRRFERGESLLGQINRPRGY